MPSGVNGFDAVKRCHCGNSEISYIQCLWVFAVAIWL